MYRSRASYEPTAKFTTWLFRIATHLALNWIRDKRHEKSQDSIDDDRYEQLGLQLASREATIEQDLVRQVKFNEIRDAIEMLPSKQKAAVVMHKYEEMEYSQIAAILETSESAVKSLLFRAHQALRVRLAHLA
ncbi:MAG: RNA polymerase sigma factor [Bryobacteraceae bacterium]